MQIQTPNDLKSNWDITNMLLQLVDGESRIQTLSVSIYITDNGIDNFFMILSQVFS